MSKIMQYLPVADSRPGSPLKVSKTRTVGVTVDAEGEVRFKLNMPPAKRSPSPEAIRKARKAARLTQQAAAEKCLSALRSWQDWEHGKRRMHPATWRAFLFRIRPPPVERLAPSLTRETGPYKSILSLSYECRDENVDAFGALAEGRAGRGSERGDESPGDELGSYQLCLTGAAVAGADCETLGDPESDGRSRPARHPRDRSPGRARRESGT